MARASDELWNVAYRLSPKRLSATPGSRFSSVTLLAPHHEVKENHKIDHNRGEFNTDP